MKTLSYKKTFFLTPTSPFHFDGTFHKPSHFLNKLKLEDWMHGRYWQTLRLGNDLYGLKIEDKGTASRPKLLAIVYFDKNISKAELEGIKKEVIWRFELNADMKEFAKLTKRDKKFYPVFKKWLGMRNSSQFNLYELLIIAIVLQNTTVRRSQQMLDALLGKYGTKVSFGGKELFSIWLPENIGTEEEMRELKIGYRAKFIARLSEDFAQGKVDETRIRVMDSEAAKKELTKLFGIGPETARILLFEAFHRYDVFDHIAPWQQKIYSRLFYGKRLVPASRIRADITERYGKYSMLAVHYIWEDIFWRRKNKHIDWLEKEIRL